MSDTKTTKRLISWRIWASGFLWCVAALSLVSYYAAIVAPDSRPELPAILTVVAGTLAWVLTTRHGSNSDG
jgi:hypothetical protein